METVYDYVKAINSDQLLSEINVAGLVAPLRIDTEETAISIVFEDALSEADQLVLDGLITAHVPADADAAALATAIATLTAYLNNVLPSKQAAARAQMIAAIGPRLPLDVLETVITNTRALVGDP